LYLLTDPPSLLLVRSDPTVISQGKAERTFNTIAQNGVFEEWSAEKLKEFKTAVEHAIWSEFPDEELNLSVEKNLSKSPSSQYSSSVSARSGDNVENRTFAEAEGGFESSVLRKQMPGKPSCASGEAKFKAMSSVTKTDVDSIGITIVAFPSSVDDKLTPPILEQIVLLSELAKLLVRWALLESMNVMPVGLSPAKGKESNGSDGNKSERASVAESVVQKFHMRPLFAMCTALGVTLHDARQKPRLYLRTSQMTLSGMLDIIFCKDGKVLGGGEFKVAFISNSYLGQIYSSTFGLAAGVNNIKNWELDKLYNSSKPIYHPFNILTNGETTRRFMTTSTSKELQADLHNDLKDGSESLRRTYNILCHAIGESNTPDIEGLSLDSREGDDELGGGADEGDGKGDDAEGKGGGKDDVEGDDAKGNADDVDDDDNNSGKGGASTSNRKPLASLNLNTMNLMEHNIRMENIAFMRGRNAN
jgi:hypothetical protein